MLEEEGDRSGDYADSQPERLTQEGGTVQGERTPVSQGDKAEEHGSERI